MKKETDKELLELAAKAAGYVFFEDTLINERTGFEYNGWNPLEDDGDAFCLMVNLGLCVVIESDMVFCRNQRSDKVFCDSGNDKHSAVRRTIVRAAAEIGKGK